METYEWMNEFYGKIWMKNMVFEWFWMEFWMIYEDLMNDWKIMNGNLKVLWHIIWNGNKSKID